MGILATHYADRVDLDPRPLVPAAPALADLAAARFVAHAVLDLRARGRDARRQRSCCCGVRAAPAMGRYFVAGAPTSASSRRCPAPRCPHIAANGKISPMPW